MRDAICIVIGASLMLRGSSELPLLAHLEASLVGVPKRAPQAGLPPLPENAVSAVSMIQMLTITRATKIATTINLCEASCGQSHRKTASKGSPPNDDPCDPFHGVLVEMVVNRV